MPLTPESFHAGLGGGRTASPSASDASTVGYTGGPGWRCRVYIRGSCPGFFLLVLCYRIYLLGFPAPSPPYPTVIDTAYADPAPKQYSSYHYAPATTVITPTESLPPAAPARPDPPLTTCVRSQSSASVRTTNFSQTSSSPTASSS
ncbi:hypothetical protein FRC08_005400 [Ceratobasidium sp. 394]|nr:hypothetical protein FRC08_005400 [Ceratobasidium sp. 394]